MEEFPRTTAALRGALEAFGFHPRRSRGQNFLTDAQAVDAIVRDAGVTAADRVVEVGTGPGLLTHVLCETGAGIVTFDVDERLQGLARSLRTWPERVRFEAMDVLAGKHALAPRFEEAFGPGARPAPPGRLLLVSNLPYAAATPILLGVLALPTPPDRLTVMVQEEVGEKLLARCGDRNYGAPSIAVGLKASGRVLRRFGPQAFWPRPRVRSVLLHLEPIRPAPLEPEEHAPFGAFVTALFTRRRKVLPTAMRAAMPELETRGARAALVAEGIDARARVETVEPAALLALWRRLRRRREDGGPEGL